MSFTLSSASDPLRASVSLCETLLRAFVVVGLLASASQTFAAEAPLRVVADTSGKPTAVDAVGLSKNQLAKVAKLPPDDPQWSSLLSVYVKKPTGGDQLPALTGGYEVRRDAIRFTPRFAFVPGLKYHAEFVIPAEAPGGHSQYFGLDISIPAKELGEPARVTAIYPSADILLENQLRFYVHFSKPMRQGEAYEHIKLLKADGQPDTQAFFDVGDELWDNTGTRLTLFFHPGRVKRGLQPREEFGPVLENGKSYSLAIDKAWRDADGQSLAAGFEKRFKAGKPIESGLDTTQWKITSPKAGTRDALVVRFPHPLDHALMQRMITVERVGKPFEGQITVGDEERRWEFRPTQGWSTGDHALAIDTTLEDTAGNRIGRPFEVDVFPTVQQRVTTEVVRIPFAIAQ